MSSGKFGFLHTVKFFAEEILKYKTCFKTATKTLAG
jgi:hypothetical protein